MKKQVLSLLIALWSFGAFAAETDDVHGRIRNGACYWIWGEFGISADNADMLFADHPSRA